MSYLLPPDSQRPGLSGYSPEAAADHEASVCQNLELARDGVWRPRPGTVTRSVFLDDVTHLSAHPNDEHLVVVEGGRLQLVPYASLGSPTELDSGWTTRFIKHAVGFSETDGTPLWMAPKVGVTDAIDDVSAIDESGALDTIADMQANWIEGFGRFMFALGPEFWRWSDQDDCRIYQADNIEEAGMNLGVLVGMLCVSESQALLMGTRGCSILTGSSERTWALQDMSSLQVVPYGMANVRCGRQVVLACPGRRGPILFVFGPDGSLTRIDEPVQSELEAITDWDAAMGSYHPLHNEYLLCALGRAWRYSLERKVWVGTMTIDETTPIGLATRNRSISGASEPRLFTAVGPSLVEFDKTAYTDHNGAAIECIMRTAVTNRGYPQAEKSMERVWVDGGGILAVTLYYRDKPEDAWSTLPGSTVVGGPGSSYFAENSYRERAVQVSFEAGEDAYLRELVIFESLIGGDT